MNSTKKHNLIKVALIKSKPKPLRLLPTKTLKHRRVQKFSTEELTSVAPTLEEKMEVTMFEELTTPPEVEKLATPLVYEKVAAPPIAAEVTIPMVVEEIFVPEAPPNTMIARPIEPVSTPLKEVRKSWSLGFNRFRLGDKVTFLAVFTMAITFLGGVSFAGLLQSTESVGTSGILVRTLDVTPTAPSPPSPTPPEPRIEIDVYSDVGCTSRIAEVEWGSIEVGDSLDWVLYIKNSGDTEVFLSLFTDNWSPTAVSDHLVLSWDYDGSTLKSGEIMKVVLSLDVEASTPVLGEFSFDIIIMGSAL